MLRLILGRSGSGKTETIYQRLCDRAWAGESSLILLVPEQFSFESERRLLELLGPRLANAVQVLSFTRLAQYVFREVGGMAGRRLDDVGRRLLMSRAYEQVEDKLSLYTSAHARRDILESLISLQQECKQCGITPYQLEQTAEALPEGVLQKKTQELALIFSAYDAFTAFPDDEVSEGNNLYGDNYVDPLNDLTALVQKLPQSQQIRRSYIYVDCFKGFTQQELDVLRVLMQMAPEVTVALCADHLDDTEQGMGLLSPVIRTAARLREMAYQDEVSVAAPLYLRENHRAQNDALKALEAGCFSATPSVYELPTEAVTLSEQEDRRAECEAVARTLRRLLREQGGRCREFAVVARDMGPYRGLLAAAFKRQGLPFYQDERVEVANEPLMVLVSAALEVCVRGYSTPLLLRMIKTGLLGFSSDSSAKLENYVLLWKIDRRQWTQPFHHHPDGFSVREDEETQRRLAHLERLRRRLILPLERLRKVLTERVTGEEFATAVYRYLISARVDRLVRLQAHRLEHHGEPTLADRMARLWDVCMELLDRLAVLFGNGTMTAGRLAELFSLGAAAVDLGTIPQSLDAIQIGTADRMRFSQPRVVWILGANEGVFPADAVKAGLVTEEERRAWITQGLPLSDAAEEKAVEERLMAYLAMTAPSQRLYVSYARRTAKGESLAPSVLVDTVLRCVPACHRTQVLPLTMEAESEQDLFDSAAALWSKDTPQAATLRSLFKERDEYAARVTALDRASQHQPQALRLPERAHRLFGENMTLSASRVESYHRCRFAYFCQYGLRASARRAADLDALTFGTLTHYVMEQRLPEYVRRGLDTVQRAGVLSDVADTVRLYAQEALGGLEDKPARFLVLLERLTRVAGALLWQTVRELRQSQFVPVDHELTIGHAEEGQPSVPSVTLTLPDTTRVRIQGKIDRVDIYRQEETAYVRVVDYKTGSKQFRLSDVVEGINAQMLMYLFNLWENGGKRYGKVTPAGVLYMPAKLPVLAAERHMSDDKREREQTKALRMNGLLLDDPSIVRAMESDAQGLFIPAKLDKNGEFSYGSSLASLAQFGLLKRKMDTLLIDMATALRDGDIAAVPLKSRSVDACEYCDYRTVCWHETGDPVHTPIDRIDEDVLFDLEADERGDDEHG